jgi:hypothetical protein
MELINGLHLCLIKRYVAYSLETVDALSKGNEKLKTEPQTAPRHTEERHRAKQKAENLRVPFGRLSVLEVRRGAL